MLENLCSKSRKVLRTNPLAKILENVKIEMEIKDAQLYSEEWLLKYVNYKYAEFVIYKIWPSDNKDIIVNSIQKEIDPKVWINISYFSYFNYEDKDKCIKRLIDFLNSQKPNNINLKADYYHQGK